MKKTTVVSIAALLVASVAAGVSATYDGPKANFAKERFNNADTNKDGTVTHGEMMAQVQIKFNEFDKNRDGFIELQELPEELPVPERMQERMQKRRAMKQERMAERGHEMQEGQGDAEAHHEDRAKRTRIKFMAKLDRDGDERITVEEFSRKAARHFKRGDVNGDGSVTLAELEEAKKHHKKKRFQGKRNQRG